MGRPQTTPLTLLLKFANQSMKPIETLLNFYRQPWGALPVPYSNMLPHCERNYKIEPSMQHYRNFFADSVIMSKKREIAKNR